MNALLKTLVLFASLTSTAVAADDILFADSEKNAYAPWTAMGQAFGPGPARGTLPGQMHVHGFRGNGLVNSFFSGDDTTRILTSPEFHIQRKYVAFLIGGGMNEQKLALQLLVNGKVVRSATGPNDKSGGSEKLEPAFWEVSEFAHQAVALRIVDDAKGGWGHIFVDHIVQTDTKPKGFVKDSVRTFTALKGYLHIPVRNGTPKRVVTSRFHHLARCSPDCFALIIGPTRRQYKNDAASAVNIRRHLIEKRGSFIRLSAGMFVQAINIQVLCCVGCAFKLIAQF
jgi:fructan beta-fructosidase